MPKLLTLAATSTDITTLAITGVSGDRIDFSYDTLSGNRPSTYANVVYLWQNTDQVPWNQPPLAKFPIQTDTQSGSGSFGGLTITNQSFILGYAVGQDVANISSTAFIPAQGSAYQYMQTNLSLQNIGINSLSVVYTTPDGYTPQTNKNWLGVWEGAAASYTNKPKWTVAVSADNSFGTAGFNGISLRRGWTYTVGYFMGGWDPTTPKQTMMAATLTFTNS